MEFNAVIAGLTKRGPQGAAVVTIVMAAIGLAKDVKAIVDALKGPPEFASAVEHLGQIQQAVKVLKAAKE